VYGSSGSRLVLKIRESNEFLMMTKRPTLVSDDDPTSKLISTQNTLTVTKRRGIKFEVVQLLGCRWFYLYGRAAIICFA
jgi:hypothetical protein